MHARSSRIYHIHTYFCSRDVPKCSPTCVTESWKAPNIYTRKAQNNKAFLMAITWLDWFKGQLRASRARKNTGTHEHCTHISPPVTTISNLNNRLKEQNFWAIVLPSPNGHERKSTCSSYFLLGGLLQAGTVSEQVP